MLTSLSTETTGVDSVATVPKIDGPSRKLSLYSMKTSVSSFCASFRHSGFLLPIVLLSRQPPAASQRTGILKGPSEAAHKTSVLTGSGAFIMLKAIMTQYAIANGSTKNVTISPTRSGCRSCTWYASSQSKKRAQ